MIDIEAFRHHCISKKGVTEEFPFGENTLVFKVKGKIFTITDLSDFTGINLKAEPEVCIELREKYEAVQPGYHMNKKHWITVGIDGSISDKLILKWIDNSYNLVVSSLTKAQQKELS
jgi:predicted DNA-binding protein (MmcQ/YjbR family)